ncbi:hypothetical protein HK099_004580 [Clydaea vesicula]|uniref:Uncharacterized protein n=1 Tax=Clydaea vesicula TaxID=447962 RepID=A0AAD5U273_9FUNG|nr:hypothetical protein HK099_004580 [Clydaea vesicula]
MEIDVVYFSKTVKEVAQELQKKITFLKINNNNVLPLVLYETVTIDSSSAYEFDTLITVNFAENRYKLRTYVINELGHVLVTIVKSYGQLSGRSIKLRLWNTSETEDVTIVNMSSQAVQIGMPGYGKRIVSKVGDGTYINIDSNKVVTIKEPAMLGEYPSKNEPNFDLILSGEVTPGVRTETDKKWTVTRDIAISYDDGSVTTALSIAGCIVAYRANASMDLYPHQNSSRDGKPLQYRGIYGVTTVSVGIPEKRYTQIMEKLHSKYKQFKYVADEDIENGCVWINASIGTKKYPEDNDAYDEMFQNQVIVAGRDKNTKYESLGPIRDVLRTFAKSLKVVIYGTLRVKAQLTHETEKKVRKYKLGMSVNYFQLYDISDIDGPGLRDVTEHSVTNSKFRPTARLTEILRSHDEQQDQDVEVLEEKDEDNSKIEDTAVYEDDDDA